MNPLSLVILIACLAAVAFMPQRRALLGMLIGTLYLSQGAALELAGFNLSPMRIIGYVAFVRVLFRKEFSFHDLVKIDKIFILLYTFVTFLILARGDDDEGAPLTLAKFLDAISLYCAFRAFIRSADDFRWILKTLALLLIPYVGLLAMEGLMRKNLFSFLGGDGNLWVREGGIRCFGSFRHPSLLGSLGACFFPVFVGLAFDKPYRFRAILGCVLCLAIVGFSNSGGPISVLVVGIIGWVMWPMRTRMQLFRRSLVAAIILLGLIMKAPIWYLLARISSFTGGTGWHRSYLMDVSFQHLSEWWLFGLSLKKTSDWMPYVVTTTGGADITNQFIAFGLQGGIWAMGIFIALLVAAFSLIGSGLQSARTRSDSDPSEERLLWGLGVALAAHVSNWMGITYFDQFFCLWVLQFAAIVQIPKESIERESEGEDGELEEVGQPSYESASPGRMAAT